MAKRYKKILLGVVLDPACDKRPIKQALEWVDEYGATLYLVHAIEHLSSYGAAYGVAAGVELEETLIDNAQKAMDALANKLNVPPKHRLVVAGLAKHTILSAAKRFKTDLIVVGSHGRHGVQLLLGSTANAVLHSAHCDVLAVRV